MKELDKTLQLDTPVLNKISNYNFSENKNTEELINDLKKGTQELITN